MWHLPFLGISRALVSAWRDVHDPEWSGATNGERRLHAAAWQQQYLFKKRWIGLSHVEFFTFIFYLHFEAFSVKYWNTVGYGKVLCNVWYETCLVSHSLFSLSPGGHRYSYKSPHHFHTLGCSHEGRKVGSEGGRGQLVARGKVNPFLAITSGLAPKACWMREGEGRERVCCTPSLRCAAVFCLGALVRQGEWTLCEHCERRDWSVIGVNIGHRPELRHPGGRTTTQTAKPSRPAELIIGGRCFLDGIL